MPWVALCPSASVAPGEARPIDRGDDALVVWRTAEGVPCVMDARCPHQWSHLAYEGVVDGDELVCTAHFWRFDRAGRGTKLAFTGRRDEKSDVRVYGVREDGGQVWADVP